MHYAKLFVTQAVTPVFTGSGVGSPVRNARMAEMNSRRRGMVLLSPATESSSGDDSPRRHYEGVWSKRARGVSCEPCLTRHTVEQERNARMERRIYDSVASDDAVLPKGKLSTKSHFVANPERNQYTTAELCSSPVSYSPADTSAPVYRCGVAVESIAPVQRSGFHFSPHYHLRGVFLSGHNWCPACLLGFDVHYF